jgi:CubicO group peptidase (beta-lactamase class C family)
MRNLNDVLSTPIIQTLGLTLLHFLWQGTLIAIMFAVILYLFKGSSSTLRYNLSCVALAVMVIVPIATFIYLLPSVKPVYNFVEEPGVVPSSPTEVSTEPTEVLATETPNSVQETSVTPQPYKLPTIKSFKQYLPWLVVVWLLGVMILSIRLLGGLYLAHKLRTKGIKPVSEILETKLQELIQKLRLSKKVRLRESVMVNVPVVIGWLKPVILLPASVLSGLSSEQLELILAHELAHIRRNDYLVNILQKVAETLLFYHPAIWWISGVIRQERENCCDDLAIQICQSDKLHYARTLAHLETLRPSSQLAMAANGGSLLKRIQRLAGAQHTEISNPAQWLIATCLAILPWMILSVATAQASLPKVIEDNIDAFIEERLKTSNMAGSQVVVVKDGQITFHKAFGLADIENNIPMTIDTPIPVGTLSRVFTFIAIMQLVEQGKLRLDGTLAEYLPWVKLLEDKQNTMTLQDLLTPKGNHGYDGSQVDSYCKPDCTALIPSGVTSKEAYIESLMPDELFARRYEYEALSIRAHQTAILLGLIIEKISGMPFEDYIQANIIAPLQLNATFDLEVAKKSGLPMGYSALTETKVNAKAYTMPSIFNPYSGLIMSSRDFATFAIALLARDSRILTSATWETLLTPDSGLVMFGGLVWGPDELRGLKGIAFLSNLDNMSLIFDILPEINTAHITLQNWQAYNIKRTQSIHIPLMTANMMLNEEQPFEPNPLSEQSWPNPTSTRIERVSGTYSSPVGPIELFAQDEELHGRMMDHEFKLEYVNGDYLSRSDYKPIDGLYMIIDQHSINIPYSYSPFAYRIEDSE